MEEGICALSIPIVAIIAGITSGIFAMYFKHRSRQRFFEEREKLIDAMRETGEIDVEKIKQFQDPKMLEGFMSKDDTHGDRTANLKAGIILLAITAALWLVLRFYVVGAEGEDASIQVVALFPGLLGVAFIVIHYTCTPKRNNSRHKDNDLKKFQ